MSFCETTEREPLKILSIHFTNHQFMNENYSDFSPFYLITENYKLELL